MKIGIIGAMDVEVDGIIKNIDEICKKTYSGTDYFAGKMFGKDVVVAKCGEGKVNSAMTAQTMILKFNPDIIINTGVAGGLHQDMKVLDIAVAKNVCEHDFDLTPLGYKAGYVPQVEGVFVDCDDSVNDCMLKTVEDVCGKKPFFGTIASGDQFVASFDKRNKIKEDFDAIATEMEGASIGHVCHLNNQKFSVLRVISDNADGSADMSFDVFAKKAADISVKITMEFVKNYE